MVLPRAVARFNKRVTNRFLEPIARRSSGFAVVHHRGRMSGASYTTPLNLFTLDDRQAIVSLTYGPSADWVQNVLAGLGTFEDRSGRRKIESVTIVGRAVAWPALPRVVRLAVRLIRVREFLLLSFSAPDRSEENMPSGAGDRAARSAAS